MVAVDHGDQFIALGRLNSIVASLVFGDRRDRIIRKRFCLLGSRSCLVLDVTARSSRQVRDFLLLKTRSCNLRARWINLLVFLLIYALCDL